jgi:hypothetical protein
MTAAGVAVALAAVFAVKRLSALHRLGVDDDVADRRMRIGRLGERLQIDGTARQQPTQQIPQRHFGEVTSQLAAENREPPADLGLRQRACGKCAADYQHDKDRQTNPKLSHFVYRRRTKRAKPARADRILPRRCAVTGSKSVFFP